MHRAGGARNFPTGDSYLSLTLSTTRLIVRTEMVAEKQP
jgi:hypothetical protein